MLIRRSVASDLGLHCLQMSQMSQSRFKDNPLSTALRRHSDKNSAAKKNITWISSTTRKHAYSNTLKILPPKNESFQIKNSDIFYISAQNIDCGYSLEPPRRGGSNGYPQSTFLSRNKKYNVYPCKPQF